MLKAVDKVHFDFVYRHFEHQPVLKTPHRQGAKPPIEQKTFMGGRARLATYDDSVCQQPE
ncbi:hypothetical protein AT864_03210 [Anoxybacillus sp. P3H1B]|uniref:hypothetical protein n=1 Tax=Anoxybacillaceae TaxID=3120669 RepID=UPI00079620D3|nr:MULTISPECIES: hypothetical protein [Anoxybacillus]KXG08514.1 hypothetical protein AT864_03210 [Anoxybacillus sp. P3H1B]MBB3908302.1 hypothetical protein [Anoxybacillus rupiensis]OQM45430.1 hypothetical protein B6A27_11655 [Anoxybacillus sp. UARK-01]